MGKSQKYIFVIYFVSMLAVVAGSIFVTVTNIFASPNIGLGSTFTNIVENDADLEDFLNNGTLEETAVFEESGESSYYVPWEFTTYDRRDFKGVKIEKFSPQLVEIGKIDKEGWAELLGTNSYVNVKNNMEYVPKTVALHDNMGDEAFTDVIHPQLVNVQRRSGNWLEIDTYMGSKWINLDFVPPTSELDEFMAKYGNTVSVFYENIESGFTYGYNENKAYFGASAIKAPYVLWLFELAEEGKANLDEVHAYTAADKWGGTGIIQNMPYGTTFTEHELIRLTLTESDNVAFRMFVKKFYGESGFRDFVEEMGGEPERVHNVTYNELTVADGGLFAREINKYIEGGHTFSEEFRQDLLDNKTKFVVSDYQTATKSGWDVGGFHDIAIVYAPSPYTLSIMSARDGTSKDMQDYKNISMKLQEFNDKYFYVKSENSEGSDIEASEENIEEI